MFRRGWMCNCWNLLSNLHKSTWILQMWLRWRLPKGSQNGNLICLFDQRKDKVFLSRTQQQGDARRGMEGRAWYLLTRLTCARFILTGEQNWQNSVNINFPGWIWSQFWTQPLDPRAPLIMTSKAAHSSGECQFLYLLDMKIPFWWVPIALSYRKA